MCALYLPLTKPHVQFPFLISLKSVSPSPTFCEIFLNAVSCYGVELLATRSTTKQEDTTSRIPAVAYSVYYQLFFICGHHLLHRNLRTRRAVMTWTHSVRLMIDSNYHRNYHLHQLLFSVAITVLLNIFIH